MLSEIGILIFISGIILIFIGIVLSSFSAGGENRTKVEGGGVVLIGPIPIVLGTNSKWAVAALVLAIVLTILSIILYLR
ncbi:MAG: TIGR00304 family membrane protein [Nitrososphaeria archaeon]